MTPEEKVSEKLRQLMEPLEKEINEIAGTRMGISLLIWNNTPDNRMSYIANVRREDVALALKSLLKGWEKGMPDIAAHEIN